MSPKQTPASPKKDLPWMRRAIGVRRGLAWATVGSLCVLVVAMLASLIPISAGAEALPLWVLVPLILSTVGLIGAGSLMAVWSRVLKLEQRRGTGEDLPVLRRWELANTSALVVGIACFLVAALATAGLSAMSDAGETSVDRYLPAVAVLAAVGVGLFLVAFVGGSVAGGIVLAGARWWWVGFVFSVGMLLLAYGLTGAISPAPGMLLVAVGVGGYFWALSVGLRGKRAGAIEARRRKEEESGDWARFLDSRR
ncbi:hypothetical protein ET445_04815 [Agromyces protaetiae]|uniref:Uncharacterized protein n=1 Tax=Agromyces protaetiae TaxID=2509455 RepID=A0A4P6F9Z6_9MICO|nr:hypothetical protein [Agromyces protaetiae]QAY72762.1 hypothetical protein ET445_04815 [Agromyces protaetiae]